MEISKSYDENIFNEIINLIKKRKINLAEEKLNSITEKNAIWTYLYGLMLFNNHGMIVPYLTLTLLYH